MKHKLRDHRGFTLLEVVVTFAILAIVLIPLSGAFIQAVNNNHTADDKTKAGQIAQKTMENWLNQDSILPVPTDDVADQRDVACTYELVNTTQTGSTAPNLVLGSDPPNPVDYPVEDYKVNPVTALEGQLGITFDQSGSNYIMTIGSLSPVVSSPLSLTINNVEIPTNEDSVNNKLTVSYLSGGSTITKDYFYAKLPASTPTKIVLLALADITVNANVQAESLSTDVYVYNGYNLANGSTFGTINVNAGSGHVRVIDHLTTSPTGVDVNRLYKLTVTVTDHKSGRVIQTVTDYKRMK